MERGRRGSQSIANEERCEKAKASRLKHDGEEKERACKNTHRHHLGVTLACRPVEGRVPGFVSGGDVGSRLEEKLDVVQLAL